MRILLIDDDRDLCHLTTVALIRHGHKVSAFQNAEVGINHARNFKPELILLDIMLPGTSGAEVAKMLKADKEFKGIPIIFLSALVGSGEKGLEETGLIIDGVQYEILGKPYEIEKLIEAVGKHAR